MLSIVDHALYDWATVSLAGRVVALAIDALIYAMCGDDSDHISFSEIIVSLP